MYLRPTIFTVSINISGISNKNTIKILLMNIHKGCCSEITKTRLVLILNHKIYTISSSMYNSVIITFII